MNSATTTASTQNQSTQGTTISRLPPEMFRAILRRVPAHHLIRLRSVSSGWKSVIEDICRNKTCLLIMNTNLNGSHIADLLKHFNGLLKLCPNETVIIQRPYTSRYSHEIYLSAQLCTLLAELFPHIEKFLIYCLFQYSANEFSSMLRQWTPTLTTLSFRRLPSPDLCVQINQMTNLRQVNLGWNLREFVEQLAPTLGRVQHLSVWDSIISINRSFTIEEILEDLDEQSPLTSLEISSDRVDWEDLQTWHQLNAQFISHRLTRLSLGIIDSSIPAFICEHFSSLQMLHFDVTFYRWPFDIVFKNTKHLVRLAQLTELRVDGIHYLPSLDSSNLVPIPNLRVLSLVDFRFEYDNLHEKAQQFCQFLCNIFPNVEQLNLYSRFKPELGPELERHVNLFVNLRSYDFGLEHPIMRLMD